MLTPYPQVFPQEAVMMLLDKIRGREVPLTDMIHGAWNVVGYSCQQTLGGGQIVGQEAFAQNLSDEDLLQAVLDQNNPNPEGVVSLTMIPWLLVARIALKLLISVLV